MRQKFFIFIGIIVVAGAVLFFLWAVARSLYTMFQDWRMQSQLDELADSHAERRRKLRDEARSRLDNGCDHEFGDMMGALPPDVCAKCGLSKTRPAGGCDHVWRKVPGPIPGAKCELCGKLYGAVAQEQVEDASG